MRLGAIDWTAELQFPTWEGFFYLDVDLVTPGLKGLFVSSQGLCQNRTGAQWISRLKIRNIFSEVVQPGYW